MYAELAGSRFVKSCDLRAKHWRRARTFNPAKLDLLLGRITPLETNRAWLRLNYWRVAEARAALQNTKVRDC
jgi:hypothetical protein